LLPIVDDNLREGIRTIREHLERKDRLDRDLIGIDKGILLVFAVAFLTTLFFTFYLIATNRLTPVVNVLFPILSLVLGFMSGYFAGTGRTKGQGG